MVVAGLVGFVAGAIAGGISSAIQGKFSWEAIVQGAAIGSTVGLTGGAGLAYGVTGSALASTGAVASGLGSTVGPAGATGFEQARQLLQSQQMRAIEGAEYSGVRNAVSDFINAKGNSTLTNHFTNHAGDFGYTTETQYLNGARNFLEKPLTSTIQSFTSSGGTYFRYDTVTNEFGIINQYGGISTYFRPTEGLNYWLEQIKLYAPK
ncbi:hypothetical protein [Lacrimispora celerecrescens]|uniref:hypothetical protein n=1 Tax=Lacrimispora celerecrescens TaxID=29354 RepID=UPI001FA6CDED|nr:hypothetical protein [Lacrimispora celerecrescens]